jgi:hypothetical protein
VPRDNEYNHDDLAQNDSKPALIVSRAIDRLIDAIGLATDKIVDALIDANKKKPAGK